MSGSACIREIQQFKNYHFLAFFTLFYLKQPVSFNLIKFEKNTQTEETLTLSVYTFDKFYMKSEYLIGRSFPSKFNLSYAVIDLNFHFPIFSPFNLFKSCHREKSKYTTTINVCRIRFQKYMCMKFQFNSPDD